MTVREALQTTSAALAAEPLLRERAAQDGRALVELATGLSRTAMIAHPEGALSAEQQANLAILLGRRMRFEPMQHLRGSQEFYGRTYRVTPDVLIPRPETEDIVTAVLESTPDRNAALRIADVGTGSGALAITLALELPNAWVTALDISAAALGVARENAIALGAADRIGFVESDVFSALAPPDCFDLIVANPPYIPEYEAPELHPQVRDYEPHTALFAGVDGHDVYRRLLPQAHAHLSPGGLLLLETAGRVDLLLAWLGDGWYDVRVRPDLQGLARVMTARRK